MARPNQYQKLSLQLDAENKKLKAKLAQTKKQMGGLGSAAKKMGGLIAGAFAADKLIGFGKEASKMAAQFEGVAAAFRKMGGAQYLGAMRDATRGTVNELELMRAAVQAKNFDIPMKSLASLFEFATKRSQQTGESVDYLVKSIILGIGRKSPLILDNLGISAIRLRKELKGAGTEAATVGDVAEAVGRIAQVEMEKAGDIINTTAIKTAQWGASWDNMTVSIGKFINTGLQQIAPVVDKITKLMNNFMSEQQKLDLQADELIKKYQELFPDDREKQLAAINKEFYATGEAFSDWNMQLRAIESNGFAENLWNTLEGKNPIGKHGLKNKLKDAREELQVFETAVERLKSSMSSGDGIDKITGPEYKPFEGKTDEASIAKMVNDELSTRVDLLGGINQMYQQQRQEAESLATVAEFNKQLFGEMGDETVDTYKKQKTLGQDLLSIQSRTIGGIISEGVAAIIANTLKGATGLLGLAALPLAAAAGAGAQKLFSKLIPSFAVGTDYVPHDMLAQIHKGEKIVPASQNRGGGHVTFEIRGDKLYGVLDEFNRRRSASY